jgi:hypothetical protein
MVPPTAAPLAGDVIDAVGGVLSTVTETGDDVLVFPAASRATAVSVCGPSGVAEVIQRTEKEVPGFNTSPLILTQFGPGQSRLTWTPATPM